MKFFDLSLRDVILGGQDGLVNVLGLSLGLVAAQTDTRVIIIAGLAAGFSEAISMGAVAYTSSLADRAYYTKSKNEILSKYQSNFEEIKSKIRNIFTQKHFKDS